MLWIVLIIGLLIGAPIGAFIMALFVSSSVNNIEKEWKHKHSEKEDK